MSKSKYNGVEPSAMISRYGADVTRLAILFMAPPEQDLEWDEFAVAGQARWVERVRKLVTWRPSATTMQEKDTAQAAKIHHAVHTAIMEVTRNVAETRSFNVAIACLMKLSNELAEAQNALGAIGQNRVQSSFMTQRGARCSPIGCCASPPPKIELASAPRRRC